MMPRPPKCNRAIFLAKGSLSYRRETPRNGPGLDAMRISLRPICLPEANAFIARLHRHHTPVIGWKYGIGAEDAALELCGVIVVSRPVARHLDNGWTLEVTRCCTNGEKNAPSLLYGAAWRTAKTLGYRRLVTYTLCTEPGTSLRASGWHQSGHTRGHPPGHGWENRPNRVRGAVAHLSKQRWEPHGSQEVSREPLSTSRAFKTQQDTHPTLFEMYKARA